MVKFPCGSAGKESACNVGDQGSIPVLGRSPGEGHGYPVQHSGLKNSVDCIIHGIAKSWTWLSDFDFHGKILKKSHALFFNLFFFKAVKLEAWAQLLSVLLTPINVFHIESHCLNQSSVLWWWTLICPRVSGFLGHRACIFQKKHSMKTTIKPVSFFSLREKKKQLSENYWNPLILVKLDDLNNHLDDRHIWQCMRNIYLYFKTAVLYNDMFFFPWLILWLLSHNFEGVCVC